jgi:lipase maturation factor 1
MATPLPGSLRLTRRLFLVGLGLVHLAAFTSFWTQAHGLVGPDGVAPAVAHFERLGPWLDGQARIRWLAVPSFGWWGAGDLSLTLHGVGGVLASVLLIAGIAPRLACGALWLGYLSVFHLGGPFLSYQWDILLLEVTFVAIFLAPGGLRPRLREVSEPPRAAVWALRLILFKVMFSSGVVKLTSGDTTWHGLTALDYHFWTQPLPHGLAWYAHASPDWVRRLGVVFTFVVELLVPFLVVFNPRGWRLGILVGGAAVALLVTGGQIDAVFVMNFVGAAFVLDDRVLGRLLPGRTPGPAVASRMAAFWPMVALMIAIASSGNYGFFNLLTIVLCVSLLDDAALRRVLPRRLEPPADHIRRAGRPARWLAAAVLVAALPLHGFRLLDLAGRPTPPAATESLLTWVHELREPVAARINGFLLVNGYGLFANMTESRHELIIEGSDDGVVWKRYRFVYKPDDADERPPLAGLHMPRLDWQLWFAALAPRCSRGWFIGLLDALLRGAEPVVGLLDHNPFPAAPPRGIRVRRMAYTFTTHAQRSDTGRVWQATDAGPYCPTLTLEAIARVRGQ